MKIAMAVGGVIGVSTVMLPKAQACIAVSLVALGLIVAMSVATCGASTRLPVWLVAEFVIASPIAAPPAPVVCLRHQQHHLKDRNDTIARRRHERVTSFSDCP